MSGASSPWETYRRLIAFARPYRPLLLAGLVAALIEAAAAGGFTMLMKPIIDETFISKNAEMSLLLPLQIVALFVLRGIAGYVTDMSMARSSRGIARDLRVQVDLMPGVHVMGNATDLRRVLAHNHTDVRSLLQLLAHLTQVHAPPPPL